MSDMQISVWLRWKTGFYRLTMSLCQVLFNNLFNKILGNRFIFHMSIPPALLK